MISSPYYPACLWVSLHGMQINVTCSEPHTFSYLWGTFNSVSLIFTKLFHQVILWRSIKLRIHNGSWHEIPHVSSCKIFHFVTSYMNQKKKHKQTFESVQYSMDCYNFSSSVNLVWDNRRMVDWEYQLVYLCKKQICIIFYTFKCVFWQFYE